MQPAEQRPNADQEQDLTVFDSRNQTKTSIGRLARSTEAHSQGAGDDSSQLLRGRTIQSGLRTLR